MIIPDIDIKKILFATDLSENALHAFAYATSLANHYGAGLVILHVLAEIPSLDANISLHIGEDEWDSIKKKREQEASDTLTGKKRTDTAIQQALQKFCEGAQECMAERGAVSDETVIGRGDTAKQILKIAAEKGCDLIVMGRHGHGGFIESVIGSTARRVVKKSSIPVLVVRLPE